MIDPTAFHTLSAFRAEVYECLGARRDALFEALDAATTVDVECTNPSYSAVASTGERLVLVNESSQPIATEGLLDTACGLGGLSTR
jgi:hypothetical protein